MFESLNYTQASKSATENQILDSESHCHGWFLAFLSQEGDRPIGGLASERGNYKYLMLRTAVVDQITKS